jgi:DNA-binding MarR family transcriptional regulator
MVVKTRCDLPSGLDLAYLAFFLGLRVNELVMGRMTTAGFKGVRESHGYLIQHLIESERSITDLAKRMDVTQQAASKVVAELIGLGILEAAPARDRRAKRIRLSQRGWDCVRLGRRARAQIDRRLVSEAGAKDYEIARSILVTYLRALGGMDRIRLRRVRAPR